MEMTPPKDIDALNHGFWRWVEQHYNHTVHSEIACTPMERWLQTAHRVKLLKPEAEQIVFLFEATRKVKKDGTFSFNGRRLETDWALAGKKVTLRYDPVDSTSVLVYSDGRCFGRANLLHRQVNATLHRRRKDK